MQKIKILFYKLILINKSIKIKEDGRIYMFTQISWGRKPYVST
jgi:hypothetical protein